MRGPGEAEWESDTGSLKLELWGATALAGTTLDVAVNGMRGDTPVRAVVGRVTVDTSGRAAPSQPVDPSFFEADVVKGMELAEEQEGGHDEDFEIHYSSDPVTCGPR